VNDALHFHIQLTNHKNKPNVSLRLIVQFNYFLTFYRENDIFSSLLMYTIITVVTFQYRKHNKISVVNTYIHKRFIL